MGKLYKLAIWWKIALDCCDSAVIMVHLLMLTYLHSRFCLKSW